MLTRLFGFVILIGLLFYSHYDWNHQAGIRYEQNLNGIPPLGPDSQKIQEGLFLINANAETLNDSDGLSEKVLGAVESVLLGRAQSASKIKKQFVKETYFDDRMNLLNSIDATYLIRQTWEDYEGLQEYEQGIYSLRAFPLETEIQSRTDSQGIGPGVNELILTRFAFQDTVPPFHPLRPSPQRGKLNEILHGIVTKGEWNQLRIAPSAKLSEYVNMQTGKNKLVVLPKKVVYTYSHLTRIKVGETEVTARLNSFLTYDFPDASKDFLKKGIELPVNELQITRLATNKEKDTFSEITIKKIQEALNRHGLKLQPRPTHEMKDLSNQNE